jgi:hypothetical protein
MLFKMGIHGETDNHREEKDRGNDMLFIMLLAIWLHGDAARKYFTNDSARPGQAGASATLYWMTKLRGRRKAVPILARKEEEDSK